MASMHSLTNIGDFILYFIMAALFFFIFFSVYIKSTPHDEVKLIKAGNLAASAAFSGVLLGYGIALASAIRHSVSVLDFSVWALIALVAQIGTFYVLRRVLFHKISERIENDELPVGLLLAAISLVVGLINAACMTY